MVDDFPVLTAGPTPRVDTARWDLTISGAIDEPRRWTWDEFRALPTTTLTCDIHCVTRWSKFDTTWEGVMFRDFVKELKLTPDARHVIAHCDYGYTTNLPLETMMDDDVMLAYKYEGQWLKDPELMEHGGPVRTLVPKRYFWKSAKFLRALEFSPVDKPGFWEQAGYHNEGDPFEEERYAPRRGFW